MQLPNGAWVRRSNGDASPPASAPLGQSGGGGGGGEGGLDSSADDSIYCSIPASPAAGAQPQPHLEEKKVFVSRDTQTAPPPHDLAKSLVRFRQSVPCTRAV